MKEKTTYVIMSYIPMFRPEGFSEIFNLNQLDEFQEIIKKHLDLSISIDACLWFWNGNELSPCFIMENAQKVVNHIRTWSENKPEVWFSLAFSELNGSYGISIFPNLDKSLERFKIANQLRTGYPIDEKNSVFKFIFKPLYFVSENLNVFSAVRPKLGESIQVFFMDKKDLDLTNPGGGFEADLAIELGRLSISNTQDKIEWINEVLSKRSKPIS